MKREKIEQYKKANYKTIFHLKGIESNFETKDDYSHLNIDEILEWDDLKLTDIERVYFSGDLGKEKTEQLLTFINAYGYYQVYGYEIGNYSEKTYDYLLNIKSIDNNLEYLINPNEENQRNQRLINCAFIYDKNDLNKDAITIKTVFSKEDFVKNYRAYLNEEKK